MSITLITIVVRASAEAGEPPPRLIQGYCTMNKPINIIFDGPPSNVSGRFVEVEDDDGKSISIGKWVNRYDGYWALRITELPKMTDPEQEGKE